MNDLYQEVTDRIIKSLEAGTPPWLPPWVGGELTLPENVTSGHRYRGINILLLHLTAQDRGYTTSRWLTFKQALDNGAHVRKGETGTPVVFFKPLEIAEKANTSEATTKVIPLLRYFTVFNIDQVEGLPETLTPSCLNTTGTRWSLPRHCSVRPVRISSMAATRRITGPVTT
jgi:antirestriction protein ArdC